MYLKKDRQKIEIVMEPDGESNYTPTEKAAYPNIKRFIKDKHGGNVHTSYIAQVKRMCGLDVGEDLEEFSDELKETVRAFAERYNWWGDDNKEIYDNLIFLMPPLIMFTCFTAEIL